jgi:hypothetical protein
MAAESKSYNSPKKKKKKGKENPLRIFSDERFLPKK